MSKDLFALNQTPVGKKPIGDYEIDWSNPLARGLVLCANYGNSSPFRDTVGETSYIDFLVDKIGVHVDQFFHTTPYVVGTNEGLVAGHSTGGYLKTNATWNNVFSDHEATFYVRSRRNDTVNNVLSEFTTSNYSHYPWDGTFYNSIFRTNRLSLAYDSSIDDNLHNVIITSSDIHNEHNTYVEGLLTNSTSASWGAPTSGSTVIYGGTYKETSMFCMYNRALSASEVESLDKDPYQILKPISLQDAVYAAMFPTETNPIAVDDGPYTVTSGTQFSLTAPGILANDTYVP